MFLRKVFNIFIKQNSNKEILGIRNIRYHIRYIGKISGIRNIGYQKYRVSEISGIRNIRYKVNKVKFHLKLFIKAEVKNLKAQKGQNMQKEQKVLQTSAPRVNFMFLKQKFNNIYYKSHEKFRNSQK